MGRPDLPGGSQATARIWTICSGVNLPGGPGPGLIAEDVLDGPARGGPGRGALDADEPFPGIGPASPPEADLRSRQTDGRGDPAVALLLEGRQHDGRSLPELRGGGGGVADRPEDALLTFGDGDLGRLTRHGESLLGGCEAGES